MNMPISRFGRIGFCRALAVLLFTMSTAPGAYADWGDLKDALGKSAAKGEVVKEETTEEKGAAKGGTAGFENVSNSFEELKEIVQGNREGLEELEKQVRDVIDLQRQIEEENRKRFKGLLEDFRAVQELLGPDNNWPEEYLQQSR